MKLACYFSGHAWAGCICQRCQSTRDLEHTFLRCTCAQCGAAKHSLKLENVDERCYSCGGSGHRDVWEGETCYVDCEQCGGTGVGVRYLYRCQDCDFTEVLPYSRP
jgi:hypothetical protein